MPVETASSVQATERRLGPVVQFSLLAGPFLAMVDSSVINVAVPAIARSLAAPLSELQWVVSGYLLALATGLAASSYLARRFGTVPVYVASLAGFTAASAGCALAGSATWLIAGRIVQGLLGAPLTPLAMGMLFTGGGERRRVSPAAGLALFLPPALGPALGGLLVARFGWQAIFLINLPFGAAGVAGTLMLPAGIAPGRAAARFDPVGLLLIAAGLALTTYGTARGPQAGWWSGGSWPFWSAGGVLLACYAAWARGRADPAVGVSLLSRRDPAIAVGLSVIVAVVLFAAMFLLPVYVQDVQGRSAALAGLILLPQGLVMAAGTIAGDALSRRGLVRRSAIAGTAVLAVTTACLVLVGAATPGWLTAALLCGRGLALGLIIQPLLVRTMSTLPASELADASTLFSVVDRVGGSFGVGLLATFYQVSVHAHIMASMRTAGVGALAGPAADGPGGIALHLPAGLRDAATAGFHDTIWALVAIAGLAFALALLLRPDAAAGTASADGAAPSAGAALSADAPAGVAHPTTG